MKMLRYLLCCLGLSLASPAWSQGNIAEAVAQFCQSSDLAGATVTIDVVEVATGRQVAAFQPTTAAIPASTQKLITTAVALDQLGPDFRFTTRLLTTGTLVDGTLQGDLYIVGDGDPSLGSPYLAEVPGFSDLLDRWLEAVRRAGIRRINGRVIGDASCLGTDGTGSGWPWNDLGNYYGAGALGLNLHENFYFLDFLQRSREGSRPLLQGARPQVQGLDWQNELRSGPPGSGDQAYIFAAPFSQQAYVRGTIPVGNRRFTIKGSVPDPPRFAARSLCQHLEDHNIPVALAPETDRTLGPRQQAGKVIDQYDSPPLRVLVARTNLRSNNLYAEALLRAVNRQASLPAFARSGTEVLTDWLTAAGIPTAGLRLEDGSGLAPRNFLPASTLTALLRYQAGTAAWRSSLPVAGRTGNLKNFLRGTAAEGRLAAKSGSLAGVRAYAGYATRTDGTELAFAVLVNNYTLEGRALQRKMLRLLRAFCEVPLR